jgi:alpha-glucoside transport system permease protein
MTAVDGAAPIPAERVIPPTSVGRVRKGLTNPVASTAAILIGLIWTIPTAGLLVQSFRNKHAQDSSGWWTFSGLTWDNYHRVTHGGRNILPNVVNSIVIVIPAAIIPITVAAMASYALVWIDFRGRDWIYVAIFALQIVPLQVAVVPLLRFVVTGVHIGSVTIFPSTGLAGTVGAIWLAHACFALPLAIFLMHNFMSEIPRDLLEAARLDGRSPRSASSSSCGCGTTCSSVSSCPAATTPSARSRFRSTGWSTARPAPVANCFPRRRSSRSSFR